MTTPGTYNRLIARLRERMETARETAEESSKISINSYGAGFDSGYFAAIRDTLEEILGPEEPK